MDDEKTYSAGENLPVPLEEKFEARLARIEENLGKLVEYEVRSRALVSDEMIGRLTLLEKSLENSRRTSRHMLAAFIVVVLVVGSLGGLYMHNQFQLLRNNYMMHFMEMQKLLIAQSGKFAEIYRQLGALSALGSGGGSNPAAIKGMSALVDKILGSENNGFMMNLRIQNELLDELEGKKKHRPTRPEDYGKKNPAKTSTGR